jgi:hypothetical protein
MPGTGRRDEIDGQSTTERTRESNQVVTTTTSVHSTLTAFLQPPPARQRLILAAAVAKKKTSQGLVDREACGVSYNFSSVQTEDVAPVWDTDPLLLPLW